MCCAFHKKPGRTKTLNRATDINRDLEHKVALRTLELTEMLHANEVIIESLPFGIMLIDAETKAVLKINKSALRTLKKKDSEVLGFICHKNVCPTEEGKCPIHDKLVPFDISERIALDRDGNEIPILKSVNQIKLMGKNVLIEGFIDISEKIAAEKEVREMQDQLFHSSRLSSIGILAAGVEHEINNPLAIVLGNLDLLDDEIADAGITGKPLESIRECMAMQREALERIRLIVIGLKQFSRSGDKEPVETDINKDITSTTTLLKSSLLKAGINLNQDLGENIPSIRCIPGRFQQIVMNLVTNAADAIAESKSGTISISTVFDMNSNKIVIKVSDNGPGIDDETMENIFKPFFTTMPVGQGTGLGLSITKKLVERLSGEIKVDSSETGTCFTVELPVEKPDQE